MTGVGRFTWRAVWFLGLYILSLSAYTQGHTAEQLGGSAHETVRQVTQRVMAVVDEARAYAKDEPERYYQAVDEAVGDVIDYRGFARKVMGPYASSERYRSLDEQGRKKLRAQLDRFTTVLRDNLVTTYSKGLLAFSGSRIELSDPGGERKDQKMVSVKQLIYSDQSQPYVLMYQMGRDRDLNWKLRNLIIDNVNLGEIYKNQFQAAARKYNGDLDSVIDDWSATEIES